MNATPSFGVNMISEVPSNPQLTLPAEEHIDHTDKSNFLGFFHVNRIEAPICIIRATLLQQNTLEYTTGASIKHLGSEGGGGFLKKPCQSRRGEGVLEAGPRGQIFLTYNSTKCCTVV